MTTAEREHLDRQLVARGFTDDTRTALWGSVDDVLSHGPLAMDRQPGATGLALGYVQSGKTTAISALAAAAADEGYTVVVALLGSTNLLLAQNLARLGEALELESGRYRWVVMPNVAGATKSKELADWLGRGRVVLMPVLKHAGRIRALTGVFRLAGADPQPVIIIDDEADQASLNTQVSSESVSKTYEALGELRAAVPNHLYVQFTATPYAPLLLEPDDHMRPDFVTMLQPGPGYTGGREFFVEHADVVVRPIPGTDEQQSNTPPSLLPRSLVTAFGSFVAGSALLLGGAQADPPVSMLVHSTQKTEFQKRYHFLLERQRKAWRQVVDAADGVDDLPAEITQERRRTTGLGGKDLDDSHFLTKVRYVLREVTFWLINSATDVSKVDWNVAPVHVLVGGNKLDRGFTVEGLTVTYMNRPPSDQVDTLEQRARAYGYRGDLLPYCQFFASARTLKVLRVIVDTEYDLRARLRDWLDAGRSVEGWADQIGLLLPFGMHPSRQNVLGTLSTFNSRGGWHQLRRPSRLPKDVAANASLVRDLGLATAPPQDYGRLAHPSLTLPVSVVVEQLLRPWRGVPEGSSPGWRHLQTVDLLSRLAPDTPVLSAYLQFVDGGSRERAWDPELGFVNLLQGADVRSPAHGPWYPGDRAIGDVVEHPERLVVQVHHVRPTGSGPDQAVHALAVHLGDKTVRRRTND